MQDNTQYAQLLKAQGEYTIEVDGIFWYGYQGFMLPAYLPHCVPKISRDTALKVLKISKRPFVRWDESLNSCITTPWWYILKRGPWSIEGVSDKKKRWMIRKGKSNFEVRPIALEEVPEKCPVVAKRAASRYQGYSDVENAEILTLRTEAAKKVPGVLEYIGCFSENSLVSYSENYIQDNAVWMAIIRHNPEYLKHYSSYALMNGILEYYLNDKQMHYVLDGSRSIHHRTEFQDHLENVYGFTREYSRMNLVYAPLFGGVVRMIYPFRSYLFSMKTKWVNDILDKTCAIMLQESIRKACIP
jgi:hypothetical protein